jgi:hypothetical protein
METNDFELEDSVGYCLYCKEPIKLSEEYVVQNNSYYHLNCFMLLNEDKQFDNTYESYDNE